MADMVTVAGLVATPIKHTVTSEGLDVSTFRLASTSRRYDRSAGAWVDGATNWFTVAAFRQLAANMDASLEKGHRVVVSGRLQIREWHDGEKVGRDVEIVADALGPDLAWGTASYTRTPRQVAAATGPASVGSESSSAAGADAAGADASGFPAAPSAGAPQAEAVPAAEERLESEVPVPF